MKSNKYSVDVIIPNYNKGKYLKQSIDTVLNQSFKKWKLYIIDDNSSDQSNQILKQFRNKKKIKIINLKKKRGPGNARNLGISISKSKYIAFLDSDDLWSRNKLKDQLYFMNKYSYKISYSDYVPFKDNEEKKNKRKIKVQPYFSYKKFIHDTSLSMSSLIIERSLTKKIKFRNLNICEDYLYKCEILKKIGKAFKCKNTMMYYRISDDSMQSNKIKNIIWVWKINKNYNKLNFFQNLKSIFFISINSLKKYGFK